MHGGEHSILDEEIKSADTAKGGAVVTQKDMPMEKRLDLAKGLGFAPNIDPWLISDLSSDREISDEVLGKVNDLPWEKGVKAMQLCGGLCFVTFMINAPREPGLGQALTEVRGLGARELGALGVLWVESSVRVGTVYSGRIRMPEWDCPSSSVVAFRWLEYPGRETTLHMVDGVGRIVGGVSGREHPADGIPKWCAWLNPSRHIGYYVGKEQAKAAVELAAREA